MSIDVEQAARIESAFRQAQARSSGRIVCVLAQSSSNYELLPLFWSALVALLAPWPLLVFTEISAEKIYLLQLLAFVIALAVLSLPQLRPLLTPAPIRRARAHRAALEQFALRGIAHGAERNGVLIYVSLAERFARIVADEAAAKVIHRSEWQAIVNQLLADMKRGDIEEGLTRCAGKVGDALAARFPNEANPAAPRVHCFHLL